MQEQAKREALARLISRTFACSSGSPSRRVVATSRPRGVHSVSRPCAARRLETAVAPPFAFTLYGTKLASRLVVRGPSRTNRPSVASLFVWHPRRTKRRRQQHRHHSLPHQHHDVEASTRGAVVEALVAPLRPSDDTAVGPRGADVNKKDITGRLGRSPARPGRTGHSLNAAATAP